MLSCEEPGGLFATCELGNGALCAPFPDRARSLPREKVSCRRQDGGVVKPDTVTEGVLVRVSAFPLPPRRRKSTLPCLRVAARRIYASDCLTATAAPFTPASPFPKNLCQGKSFLGALYKREVPRRGGRSKKSPRRFCEAKDSRRNFLTTFLRYAKKCEPIILFREQGFPALRAPICAILGAYCSIKTKKRAGETAA